MITTLKPPATVLAAMALIAGAVALFQIALMRVFSFTVWHHFAFMVMSVAMLGFGASGVFLHRLPQPGRQPARAAALASAAFAVTSLLATGLAAHLPFDPTEIGHNPLQLLWLAAHYLVLLVPFGCAGLALVLLLQGYADSVGRLYASDLAGAACGSLLTIGALAWVGAEGVLWTAAGAAAAASWLLQREVATATRHHWPAGLLLLLAVTAPVAPHLLAIPAGQGKALHDFLDPQRFPEARIVHTEWNVISRIDVVANSGTVRWTAHPFRDVALPAQTQIVIDGDAATPIVDLGDDPEAASFLDFMLSTAASQAANPQRVLVIGAGGGVDVLAALHHGAREVDALEVNPAIVRLVRERQPKDGNGPFAAGNVRFHVAEGRAFVRQTTDRFDLIQMTLVDTWAATASGAYSLTESYLYTVEAFADYLERLTDHGALTITRWLWSPPRETLKLFTTALEALERRGVAEPNRHIVVLALGRFGNLIVKREPFTAAELTALLRVAAERQFTLLYVPGAAGDNEFMQVAAARDRSAWIDAYRYDVRPATDSRPFFFQFGRWRDLVDFRAGWSESLLILSGRLVLLTTLAQALLLSLLLLIVPARRGLAPAAGTGPGRGAVGAYFAAIGASFMLIEISLMQRFTLFLGHPLHAIACVLAVLLAAAGAGSLYVGTGARRTPRIPLLFGAITMLCVSYGFALPHVFASGLGWPLIGRIAATAAFLLPLGFLLGMPFPLAVAALRRHDGGGLLGWAWAANGFASVVGPLVAVMIAMDFGFDAVLALAALGYLAAGTIFSLRIAGPDPGDTSRS
jgi:hypothetical protein